MATGSIRRPGFWLAFVAGCALTLLSVALRALRWIFLLRRSETRIPIRDAYIGYLAGFSLMLAPLLLGEVAVRAYVHRERGHVPYATTIELNAWERLLDATALAGFVAILILDKQVGLRSVWLLAAVAATCVQSIRQACLHLIRSAVRPLVRLLGEQSIAQSNGLITTRAWLAALTVSFAAWALPGMAFWGLTASWQPSYPTGRALREYSAATLLGGLSLAPGGILVTGRVLMSNLHAARVPDDGAALIVLATRMATTGLSTALGVVFVLVHLRRSSAPAPHFDEIADVYDVQIPTARREMLLARKTALMSEVMRSRQVGLRGLDIGCGQGWHVCRMRAIGFDVVGIDASLEQVQIAAQNLNRPELVRQASVLHLPFADATYDFVYTINVLHHLESVAAQRAAFAEIKRVLRPGGLAFLHEINTRNIVFRFYMGYVFPSLNCIDEGVERWILPHRLERYTDMPVIDARYFTFLPDFLPESFVRALRGLERRLEDSRLRRYAAHYMVVLERRV